MSNTNTPTEADSIIIGCTICRSHHAKILKQQAEITRLQDELLEARTLCMEYASASMAKQISEKYGIPLPDNTHKG